VTALQLKIDGFQSIIESLQQRVVRLESTPPATYQNITYVTGAAASLNPLFEQVKGSVVVVQGLVRQVDFFGRVFYSQVQGSGFVCNYSGRMVILTNNHVINGAINVTVTFNDGTVFSTTTIGSNANTDFAVLNPATSISNYRPLEIISSSMLKVGDPVIVVGTPYGLAGSMSNGIVSALNRTLSTSANVEIYNVIQTTAPLNPGNSGGPVMNYNGQVIGIATAIVQESQGIGFAIPSDTILSELQRILG
jgi:serine protease Do